MSMNKTWPISNFKSDSESVGIPQGKQLYTLHTEFISELRRFRQITADYFRKGNHESELALPSAFSTLPIRSASVAACNCIAGSSQIFSQFQFHLNRCFKRHRVQVFVKLRHQSHAILPNDPSRFVAVLVIFRIGDRSGVLSFQRKRRVSEDRVWDSVVKWKDALRLHRAAESRKHYDETLVLSEALVPLSSSRLSTFLECLTFTLRAWRCDLARNGPREVFDVTTSLALPRE